MKLAKRFHAIGCKGSLNFTKPVILEMFSTSRCVGMDYGMLPTHTSTRAITNMVEKNVDDQSELVNGLFDKNDKVAYKCLKELLSASEKDNSVYRFFDTFASMIDNENSYIRTRGLLLISANAKWDSDNKIDEIIDKYLRHIMDDKPILI